MMGKSCNNCIRWQQTVGIDDVGTCALVKCTTGGEWGTDCSGWFPSGLPEICCADCYNWIVDIPNAGLRALCVFIGERMDSDSGAACRAFKRRDGTI